MSTRTAAAGTRRDAYRLGLCVNCRTEPRSCGQGSALCAGCHAQSPKGPHDAYRRGLCVACWTGPPSAGRPRCADCHRAHTGTGAR